MKLLTRARIMGALLGVVMATPAQADTLPDLASIRGSIVIVLAKGVLTKLGNAPAATQGTGFFIGKAGFLVTSNHLRTELGDVDDATVTYEIHFGTTTADVVQAIPVFVNPVADVMVLYASVADRNVPVLAPATHPGVPALGTSVYTVGYPAGYQYSVDAGVIKSSGPIDPVLAWTTSLTFKGGQSGSPILLSDLRVIAIAKGNDAQANSIGLVVPSQIVPSNFWDGTVGLTPAVTGALASGDASSLAHVNVSTVSSSSAPVARKEAFTVENAPCDPSGIKSYYIKATPGWVINPDSIRVEMLAFAGASPHYAIAARDEHGFTVAVELQNIGQCLHVLGTVVTAGVPARFTGQASFNERPQTPGSTLTAVSSAAAIGNVQTPLPNVPLNQLKFSVSKPSGEVVPFTPTPGELTRKNGVLALDIQKVEQRVSHSLN